MTRKHETRTEKYRDLRKRIDSDNIAHYFNLINSFDPANKQEATLLENYEPYAGKHAQRSVNA